MWLTQLWELQTGGGYAKATVDCGGIPAGSTSHWENETFGPPMWRRASSELGLRVSFAGVSLFML